MQKTTRILKSIILTGVLMLAHHAQATEVTPSNAEFVPHKISDSLYAIGEPNYYQKNFAYLLVGKDRALMFDSGASQTEDITKVARQITDKPLSVIPSHLHFDHLGGLHNFQSIYLVDLPFTRKLQGADGLYRIPAPVYLADIDHMDVKPFKVDKLIKPGEKIDLGGLSIKVLSTPGHTQDEISLYIESENVLLSGDHLYPSWLLAGNIDQYIRSLDMTLSTINTNTVLYGAHADTDANQVPRMNYQDVVDVRDEFMKIKAGTAKSEKFSDPDLIKNSRLYKVNDRISILTKVEFVDGNHLAY